MKTNIFTLIFLLAGFMLYAQDTLKIKDLNEVVITANRLPMPLKQIPCAMSIVGQNALSNMPKGIAAEEALRLVPGVRIDNQHDGERVHLSIRGQGILTERGLRGIGVLIDGIPVNDPSGFAPDLFDVDWSTIKNIEVLRGPVASLYGGGGSAGVINIATNNGGSKPIGGEAGLTMGSNGYLKGLVQLDGSKENMDYRVSYSRTKGDGYRDHQAFWGNVLYEKVNFHPSKKLQLTQIISHSDYFHQNPEGLNIGQFNNLLQANPDACPFNEYQKTNRTTVGLIGTYKFNDMNDLQLTSYYRTWRYKETSNRVAEYRNYTVPGVTAQYNLHFGKEKIRNHISVGVDLKWQDIAIYKLQSASDPDRQESTDETNIELDTLKANQLIAQSSTGAFLMYKLEAGKFSLLGNLRYDAMNNELTDKMTQPSDTSTTNKDFSQVSVRLGANYSFAEAANVFANWSQGFLPPSTEELASNPVGYSGFNTHLVPATSNCFELGLRGRIGEKLFYELTGFMMNTEDDFFRFKQSGRGNQEVFYGNAGNSKRNGVELYLSFQIIKSLNLQAAYTFADYKYTSATIDPVYTDTAYVLTTPPADGQWLPNSPQHQLYAELQYSITKNFKLSAAAEMQSKWAIYTDAKAYAGEMDPAIYQNWQDGFTLIHARAAYQWHVWGLNGELSLFVRNLTGEKYMAFTEPDPDGNSYQPGPSTEIFGGLKIKF
jgi:iron complex outermembrane receptor protein